MSTFTDWNGPQGTDVRAKDLAQLVAAYSELVTKLDRHVTENVASTGVHSAKDYVDKQVEDIKKLIPNLSGYLTEIKAANDYAVKTHTHDNYVIKTELAAYLKEEKFNTVIADYLKKSDLATDAIIKSIKADISAIEAALKADVFEVTVLSATEYVKGILHAIEQVQFTDAHVNAYIGGSGSADPVKGVYYILGMMDKAGTAYINYKDDKPFKAVVNFTETNANGALSVTCDNTELTGLKFLIVKGTDSAGTSHYYLAVQADEWMSHFASSDGVGHFTTIDFDVAGINFYPVDSAGFKRNNANCDIVVYSFAGNGLSANAFATDEFKTTDDRSIFKVLKEGKLVHLIIADKDFAAVMLKSRPYLLNDDGTKSPFLTTKDIALFDEVGVIRAWPLHKEVGDMMVADNIPAIDLACDGAEFDTDTYPELYAILGDNHTPVIDYHVIKAKSIIDIIEDFNTAGGTLADAVATIHETKVYTSVNDLPDTAAEGTLAIVQREGVFFVYERTATGWEVKA